MSNVLSFCLNIGKDRCGRRSSVGRSFHSRGPRQPRSFCRQTCCESAGRQACGSRRKELDRRVRLPTSDSSRQSSASRQLIIFRRELKIFLYRRNLDAYTKWTVYDAFYHSIWSGPAALSRRFHCNHLYIITITMCMQMHVIRKENKDECNNSPLRGLKYHYSCREYRASLM